MYDKYVPTKGTLMLLAATAIYVQLCTVKVRAERPIHFTVVVHSMELLVSSVVHDFHEYLGVQATVFLFPV